MLSQELPQANKVSGAGQLAATREVACVTE
jgi:hypothetical protein